VCACAFVWGVCVWERGCGWVLKTHCYCLVGGLELNVLNQSPLAGGVMVTESFAHVRGRGEGHVVTGAPVSRESVSLKT